MSKIVSKKIQIEKMAFISPPKKINPFLKIGIMLSNKVTGKELLVPKLLALYPKVAISSGILEVLVAHGKKDLNKRLLKLVRIQTSLTVACPFCIDMNSFGYKDDFITDAEMDALSGGIDIDSIKSFSKKESIVLAYVRHLYASVIVMPKEISDLLIQNFTEREIVILASTVAQVNYRARLIQGLGVPPEGFMDHCEL